MAKNPEVAEDKPRIVSRKRGTIKKAVEDTAEAAGSAIDATTGIASGVAGSAQGIIGEGLEVVSNVGGGLTDILGGLFGGLKKAAKRFQNAASEENEDTDEE